MRPRRPVDFDTDTPYYEGIEDHARRAAGAAIEAVNRALVGEKSFALMRPPGHHAMRDRAMGFCYLNSMAIAAFSPLKQGCERVAIWDLMRITATEPRPSSITTPGSGSRQFINTLGTQAAEKSRSIISSIGRLRPGAIRLSIVRKLKRRSNDCSNLSRTSFSCPPALMLLPEIRLPR